MTGYARVDGRLGDAAWTWEVKSVNGRGLDIRCRFPAGFDRLEGTARRQAMSILGRGNVSLSLSVTGEVGAQNPIINRALLEDLLALQKELADRVSDSPPRLEALLQVRGLVEVAETRDAPETEEARDAAMLESLDEALAAIAAARRAEGERLEKVLRDQLHYVETMIERASTLAATQPDALRARLQAQVAELLEGSPQIPEERLLQEVAILATKADIREELDRLRAHVDAAKDLLKAGQPVGRRLEFLCQEFNREANTLCSKSNDIELTAVGLELKAVIDQMREQVQNVE
jgi:uncharacterized protein (TIGR00255 family)